MAMGIKGSKADINVTPMIDVLLVLLIIFMVIQPSLSVGLDVRVPQPSDEQDRQLPQRDIVLTALGGGKVRLDHSEVAVTELADSLEKLRLRYRAGVAYVKGTNGLNFAQVAEVIDVAKGAGWKKIGLMPKESTSLR